MITELLARNTRKYDAIPIDGSISSTKVFLKGFACGFIEGVVDVLVVTGAVTLAVGTVLTIIASNSTEEAE